MKNLFFFQFNLSLENLNFFFTSHILQVLISTLFVKNIRLNQSYIYKLIRNTTIHKYKCLIYLIKVLFD